MNIAIIGSGNVAFHLAQGLKEANHTISYIMSRNEIIGRELAQLASTDFFLSIPPIEVDLVLVCVNDDSIIPVIRQFPKFQKIAYTSGTVDLQSVLNAVQNPVGVFYPLQSFSVERALNLTEVPFLIEAKEEQFGAELFALALTLSSKVNYCSSLKRKHYHVAAVMVNNFTNHLYFLGKNHLEENELQFDLLYPLINETILKAKDLGPYNAQTGPARRKDLQTIQEHLNLLDEPTKEIYKTLSDNILKTYPK